LFAVQLSDAAGVGQRIVWLPGLNMPPGGPAELNPDDGLTESCPDGLFTVRLTGRVVLRVPLVMFVKVTVSEKPPPDRLLAFALIETVSLCCACRQRPADR